MRTYQKVLITIGDFFGLLFLIQWGLVAAHVQFSFTLPDSKYVTVFNQVDKEREVEQKIALLDADQQRESKKKS